ncbi:MAG: hypothetical protein NTW87_31720 [Planctomycetota bacterium]|nr:hypothetical protein [Planctomycetota bacterium]
MSSVIGCHAILGVQLGKSHGKDAVAPLGKSHGEAALAPGVLSFEF